MEIAYTSKRIVFFDLDGTLYDRRPRRPEAVLARYAKGLGLKTGEGETAYRVRLLRAASAGLSHLGVPNMRHGLAFHSIIAALHAWEDVDRKGTGLDLVGALRKAAACARLIQMADGLDRLAMSAELRVTVDKDDTLLAFVLASRERLGARPVAIELLKSLELASMPARDDGAVESIQRLRDSGVDVAVVTYGEAKLQRNKLTAIGIVNDPLLPLVATRSVLDTPESVQLAEEYDASVE